MDLRPADVDALVAQVRGTAPRLGDTRLVLVDGPAGSGKSTLASRLAAALDQAPVVPMDDLYEGWSGLAAGVWERLRTQVLDPVAAGGPARYRRYDWLAERFGEWVEVAGHDVLVVEGVGAAAAAVRAAASLTVWVEAPRDERLRRGLARDGEAMTRQWLRWSDREDAHFAADATREHADVLVDGTVQPRS